MYISIISESKFKDMSMNLLSSAETKTLEELCKGKLYKEIAYENFISINTVKKHLKSIYKKMGVKSRSEACDKYNSFKIAV
jgi:LuxR family maltose regulon positive regulatory protein